MKVIHEMKKRGHSVIGMMIGNAITEAIGSTSRALIHISGNMVWNMMFMRRDFGLI